MGRIATAACDPKKAVPKPMVQRCPIYHGEIGEMCQKRSLLNLYQFKTL